MASPTLKKNYRSTPALQQFYTGGPFAVASDSSFIVCACDDAIKMVDSSNASIRSVVEGDSQTVTALALSPDDRLLFSSSHSRQIRVWELSSLKCIRSWKVKWEVWVELEYVWLLRTRRKGEDDKFGNLAKKFSFYLLGRILCGNIFFLKTNI